MKLFSALLLLIICLTGMMAQSGRSKSRAGTRTTQEIICRDNSSSPSDKVKTVFLTVIDRKTGKRVGNLKKEDLRIFENNIEQETAFFTRLETPVSVFLLIDTSFSVRGRLKEISSAANVFIENLRMNDLLSVISFDGWIKEHFKITKLIDLSHVNFKISTRSEGTSLYDTVDFVIKKRLKDVSPRKIIILFTDGVDSTSRKASAEDNYYEAQEADVIIYPLQYNYVKVHPQYERIKSYPSVEEFVKVYLEEIREELKKRKRKDSISEKELTKNIKDVLARLEAEQEKATLYLRELAGRTGGSVYSAETAEDLNKSFASIIEEVSSQYVLCFYSPNSNGATHSSIVRVRANNPDLIVREYVK